MKKLNPKTIAILIAAILLLSMAFSIRSSMAQIYPPPGTHATTHAQINVAPNPAGIGQTVTVNMYLAVPLESSGNNVNTDRGQNYTLYITDPSGTQTTLGPFTSDATGGTYTTFAPDKLGNYTLYWKYPGQTLTGANSSSTPPGWGGIIEDPSTSPTITLVVQQEPVSRSSFPITPLPTSWWETPASAENIQNWYAITGPWLGLSANSFATTGSYNCSTYNNPYTESVYAGHIIWTLPWGPGGIPGGEYGGTESSNFWTTRQYSPNFAPVMMNGILYSTQYTTGLSTGANNGIVAVNLFTGQQLFVINTTNSLRCGMMFQYKNPNQYGVVGPWLWTTGTLPAQDTGGNFIAGPGQSSSFMNTTGTQWNEYDATTGRYVLSIVNGSALTLSTDDQGGLVGYYLNNTAGKETVYPTSGGGGGITAGLFYASQPAITAGVHLECFNFSTALIQGSGTALNFQPNRNLVIDWRQGLQFAINVPTNISGVPIVSGTPATPNLAINSVTEYDVALTTGFIHAQGTGGEQWGWLTIAGMDAVDGHVLFVKNVTQSDTEVLTPNTRLTYTWGAGRMYVFDGFNWKGICFDARTGAKLWEVQLVGPPGYTINPYDVFNFKAQYADGLVLVLGFGGDIIAVNATTGQQAWASNTNIWVGDPGIETPYGTWPLWVFSSQCQSSDIEYAGIGHEYNPPLFHGAQLVAINLTDGSLVWSELGFDTRAMAIADGILITNSAYDNQIYAFAKGPTQTTVTAPSTGVTTSTPITIRGTITDISAGTSQDAVKKNFPNGVPCVSDQSMSHFMEYVYQQQPVPANTTGVPITINVIDANNNFRAIGTTTSDASGMFTLNWTPDIPGAYTVIANFAGTNSYYGSYAETSFISSSPQTSPTATAQTNLATSDLVNNIMIYLVAGIIVIIIAIAIVGLLILRKHP